MPDFPYAYKKVFIISNNNLVTSGTSDQLPSNGYGFFDARTWEAIPYSEATITDHPAVVFVAPSFHTTDKIGSHGGYKETLKSHTFKANQVVRFWRVSGRDARSQVVSLGWDFDNEDTAPRFVCGREYTLRIDLRGTPVLRALGVNAFRQFTVHTGCCADPSDPQPVDPVAVMVDFAKQINGDSILRQFVTAVVYQADGPDFGGAPDLVNLDTYVPLTDPTEIAAATAMLQMTTGINERDEYDACSYDPREEVVQDVMRLSDDPPRIIAAQLLADSFTACPDFKQLTFVEWETSQTAEGSGRKILRDFILSQSYRQEFFPFNPRQRQREVENVDNLYTLVSPTKIYNSYYILHRADRRSNPSSVYDNDYYLIQISWPADVSIGALESWMNSYLDSAFPGMVMEDLTDPGM